MIHAHAMLLQVGIAPTLIAYWAIGPDEFLFCMFLTITQLLNQPGLCCSRMAKSETCPSHAMTLTDVGAKERKGKERKSTSSSSSRRRGGGGGGGCGGGGGGSRGRSGSSSSSSSSMQQ